MSNQSENRIFYNEIALTVAEHVQKFTPQIFSVRNHESTLPPSPHSSSVLIKIAERHILISAAHTFHNENLQNIGFMIQQDFIAIGGQLRYFEPNDSDNYEPTKKDIAFFELDDVTIEAFKEKYDFLEWDKLGFNHFSEIDSKYLIFGYPSEMTRKNFPAKLITPSSLKLRTIGVPPPYYRADKINIFQTLILLAVQDNITGADTFKKLPVLGGISGCGVWDISNTSPSNPEYKLVSIMTGENESQTVLYSTKIDELLQYLPPYN